MDALPRTIEGMASIQQRGSSWRVLWRLGGRGGRQQSTTWPTPELAKRAADLAAAHRHAVTADDVYDMIMPPSEDRPGGRGPTVAQFASRWLASRTRLTPGQVARYRSQLDQRILPAIGHLELRELNGTHVATMLNRLKAAGLKDGTLTRYYACLHAMLAFAVLEKEIGDNPARRTDFIRDIVSHDDLSDDGDDHVYLTRYEYGRILEHMKPAGRVLVEFLAGTGCRFSEATAVAVEAVDPFARTVRIHRAWKYDGKGGWYLGTTKGRRRRTVSLGAGLVDTLAPLIAGEAGDQLLFRAPRGGRINHSNFANRLWFPALAAASSCELHEDDGCECPTRLTRRPTLHDLRHSHVAWLIAAGRPIASISRRLGHHTTTITEQVYAGILPEVQEADAEAIDAVLSGRGGTAMGGATGGRAEAAAAERS